jgi:hypothetical protein
MKKVLCPVCGLMNLEKFVTFPNCAGCGARLPVVIPETSLFERWKRPLRAPLWATFVALCCAALGFWSLTFTRETDREDIKLVAYVQLPHEQNSEQTVAVKFQLDTTQADDSVTIPQFSNVRLRIAKATFDDFSFVAVSPRGRSVQTGGENYIIFGSIARNQPLQILLRPRRAGKCRLAFSLIVPGFSPFLYQGTMKIVRAKGANLTNSGQHLKLAQ